MQKTEKLIEPAMDKGIDLWGGIECTINRVQNQYYDQLEFAGLYQQPKTSLLTNLGFKCLRFPILWEKHAPEKDTNIDWSYTDEQVNLLHQKGVDVIAGLVHHGSGPAFTNLLDPEFPYLLADYAKKVAQRYPWIKYYTPINEPLTTARFSGLYGLWFPHHKKDKSFLLMLLNQLKAVVLAMQEIRKINPEAKLVQTEDLGKTFSTPKLAYQARFENERRWLTYDLLCGRLNEKHKLWKHFTRKNAIPLELLQFFQENVCTPDIFGFNHYVTSERFIDENLSAYPVHTHGGNKRHRYADVEAVRVAHTQETGVKHLLKEAWERYHQPIAITEVHLHCHREEQMRWFKYIWDSCQQLKTDGVGIIAVTAWAVFGSHNWNKLLTSANGDYEPGVYDLRRGIARPTALASFIKEISNENHHPLTNMSGWWHRDSRILYPNKMVEKGQQQSSVQAPILILGKTGTLGKAFARLCTARAIPYYLLGREDCNITDSETIKAALDYYKPWALINTAGYVKVDEAEGEKQLCLEVNEHGAVQLAKECNRKGVKLLTFSTDLVFDGSKAQPYLESDATNPLNIYGISKANAERRILEIAPAALIVRTSAFFSPWDRYNFLHWIEESLNNDQEVSVANDVTITPTYVPDLVHNSLDLLIDGESGIWHLANKGIITWADFAYSTAERNNLNKGLIRAVSLSELCFAAERPINSVLGTEKGLELPTLEHALNRYFEEKMIVQQTPEVELV